MAHNANVDRLRLRRLWRKLSAVLWRKVETKPRRKQHEKTSDFAVFCAVPGIEGECRWIRRLKRCVHAHQHAGTGIPDTSAWGQRSWASSWIRLGRPISFEQRNFDAIEFAGDTERNQ